MEERKPHEERNNARYNFWSKKKRKTKNTLRWQDNITKWTGLTGDRLLRSVEDNRGRLSTKRPILGSRTDEGIRWRQKTTEKGYSRSGQSSDRGRVKGSIEDRRQQRKIIHEAANPRIEDEWRDPLKTEDNGGRLSTKRPILGSRTSEGIHWRQKTTEKDYPRSGQSSDQGWMKVR